MRIYKLILTVFSCFILGLTLVQAQNAEPVKYRKFAIYGGVGPSYFFNNLVTGKNGVNSFSYAFSFRAMWEPKGTALSLGIESGYYVLYTANYSNPKVDIKNTAVPLQLVISMKLTPNWYTNFSIGQSFLYNKVDASSFSGNFSASSISLADLGLTLGYRFVNKARISYAAETKFFFSSSNSDATLAIFFMVGYKL